MASEAQEGLQLHFFSPEALKRTIPILCDQVKQVFSPAILFPYSVFP